ncbi:hypothetical protein [Pseudooctadecabacter jejudonensis]|uniref:EF-hand domain-containing protein n=1 Tax=Pseudooctadecabacter jejudonensis TaxID=1391910 RepID=A0A1Y5TBR9_9RHOB|nr:hypothetical protein [Pseudooctadecabacter jejudonensis]SLN60196.1 hypothetical protein PSJ8397_03209 [Pseudooctadecabacter jejudonensis]
MTNLMKTLIASAAVATLGTAALADGHSKFGDFDPNRAVLDPTMDQNDDGEITIDELIEMNMMVFDTDGNGAIDADERGEAEQFLEAALNR